MNLPKFLSVKATQRPQPFRCAGCGRPVRFGHRVGDAHLCLKCVQPHVTCRTDEKVLAAPWKGKRD